MIKYKNNLIFIFIHIIISCIFWGCVIYLGEKYIMENYYFNIVAFLFYVGISYLLSGKIIRIGSLKDNICSVLFIPIILSLIWLFCVINDNGSPLSGLVWVLYIYPLGPFSIFYSERMLEEKSIILLVFTLIPSILFWLGIELKTFYFKKHKQSLAN